MRPDFYHGRCEMVITELESLDTKNTFGAILTDLSKAWGSVNHKGLI